LKISKCNLPNELSLP
jgi:aspartate aminotransferase, mitochondrial